MDVKSFFGYILESYDMLYELFGLLIILLISVHISKRVKRLTFIVVVLLLGELVAFNLEKWTQSFSHLSLARPILTAIVYTMYPIILICIMQITIPKRPEKMKVLLLLLPELICIPIFFTSQWTHIVCWYVTPNNYMGGPLSRLPYILFGYYLLLFLVRNIIYFRYYSRLDRLIIMYIVAGAIAGVLYYIMVEENKDYSTIFSSAILLYYIYIYIHMARIDSLTKLLNRQSYYQDMEMNARNISGVISVDMNNLKVLNDSLGHEAGDEALIRVAEVLRAGAGKTNTVYRVGGDEFILFSMGGTQEQIREMIQSMREKLDGTSNSCAFGYAMIDAEHSVKEAILLADQRMYANKAEMKRKIMDSQGETPASPCAD